MSAGRNLITLFSSVNNLSRSFSPLRSRRVRTTRRAQRANAARAPARRLDTHRTNATQASIGAACSDPGAHAQSAAIAIATIAIDMHATREGIALAVAAGRRISRRTSAFARKLRELSVALHLDARRLRHANTLRASRRRRAGRRIPRRQPARKNPRRFRRGFGRAHGSAISGLRFPAARRIRPDPAVR